MSAMTYAKLGNSGLTVSRIGLGCMSYGDPDRGAHSWTLTRDRALPLLRDAYEAGINFFDTANIYSLGHSEEILGEAIAEFGRDNVVVATKVFETMNPANPLSGGLSRRSILTEVDASLRRLNTDYIDLYIIHRWDPRTPIVETMAALDSLVRAGKVRYLGASSMYAWQFSKAQHSATHNGLTPFISMQNHYNLLYREEEREMLPLCSDLDVGLTPWSPLARGKLARSASREQTARASKDPILDRFYTRTADMDAPVIDAVANVAREHGASMASIALAWLLQRPQVVSPIVGVTRPHHLADVVTSLEVRFTDDQTKQLESQYVPHEVAELGDPATTTTVRI
ncbi:aldo/keto reductase [Mycobacterium sp. PDNC021]|uniref:aldo/keto reductase n=1 Tax=Mycobacterium sp. PDNC021 TaxID=3391399 RepID=UPI003AAF5B3D